ncbi:probable inactive peptidyl-prolyl cis-trans isomerase-like 6 isoform X2 [Meles meles]|uniref:probable inactive peptidyl-prolyl cis-trans isomerase-like 6 isoform X2 n=1 Tax=Meles meles TaxID=9662 RepID=UPI001E69C9F6|nr:probable inactive peptidyl-prolyl cis-trans isomerase-like 6 isoform X2 [Meles meles]
MASPKQCRPRSAPCSSRSPPEQQLKVKVVGLFKSSSFQVAKSAAETLKTNYPSKFEDPIIVPLQEFAWDQYLQEKKRHAFVFLDISIDFYPIGRLVFELYCDACPKTCRNFQVLCTGKAEYSQSGIRLHYVGSIFHRVVPNGWIQGGDIVEGRGDDGVSIYGPTFEDENFSIPHNKRGVLGMANKGRHTNGSQFYITLQPAPYLDRKYVAFGQLIEGTEVLQKLELVPTENERPIQRCAVVAMEYHLASETKAECQ